MDSRIRKNEFCVINNGGCDYVFSSSRSCFIAYGFMQSKLEMKVLQYLLKERGVEPFEAGESIAPGQHVFCTKICSKVIASRFCVVFLNGHYVGETYVPNANVNMEYGLMLGFNKYVIPFQREEQPLPFNVSGLDTVKYNDQTFESKAVLSIEKAINDTRQKEVVENVPDESIFAFFLSRGAVIANIDDQGNRNIYDLGAACGFKLLNDFSGIRYIYTGIFTNLSVKATLWRLERLTSLLAMRFGSLDQRLKMGVADQSQVDVAKFLLSNMMIWVLVTSEFEKKLVNETIGKVPLLVPIEIFSLNDVRSNTSVLTE